MNEEKKKQTKRRSAMLFPTIIMGVLAFILVGIAYMKGEGAHVTGFKSAFKMIVEILPLLFFAFVIAGMVQVLLPVSTLRVERV